MLTLSDVYVLVGALASDGRATTMRDLAAYLALPDHSVVQRARQRAQKLGLVDSSGQPNRALLEDFLIHALPFVAPGELGPVTTGTPAAWAAHPMDRLVRSSSDDPPPVWPSATGNARGQRLAPLHPAAVDAVARHPELGELLALVDSIRAGDLRVRSVAADELRERLRRR